MDYEDDTLTNANKNRAASRKVFQQWGNGTKQTEGTTTQPKQQQFTHFQAAMSLHSSDHPQQLQHCPSSSSSPSSSPSPLQVFLHRSPSGAQRKIRQKVQQQQQNQQQFPLTNGFSVPSAQQQMPSSYGRSVIHENGYKSILDREEKPTDAGESPSLGQLIDRMNRLDSSGIGISSFADDLSHATPCPSVSHLRSVPDPSSPWAAAGGGGGGSIDKVPMPSSPLSLIGSVFGDHSHQTPSPQHNQPQQQQKQFACPSVAAPFAKPTVQVHPLPVPPRHRSLSAFAPPTAQLTTKPTPPPLPPKKHSLAMSFLVAKRSFPTDQMPSENGTDEQHKGYDNGDILRKSLRWAPSVATADEMTTKNNAKNELKTEENNEGEQWKEEEENEERREKEGKKGRGTGDAPPARKAPAECPSRRIPTAFCAQSPPLSLSTSPSLTSLQNSLQFAADNPEKHSGEQLQELERRRLYSIESLARKISDREQDRELLCRDMDEIDNIRMSLFARISHNGALVGRLNNLLTQTEKLADLETKIHFQMERMALSHGTEEMGRCLRDQLFDLRFLRNSLEERESAIDSEMAEELGEAEGLQEWLFCREQLAKLSAERCHLNMRLRDVRTLLESLQGICLMPTAKGGKENALMTER
ncbi:hypothetical protein niasHS_014633 [Heterodera schachtii]|uniref:ASD2 domain-containing protein n=1 Tax=Heterodera schachtii TaxID=97005 RepID=A0ABD2IMZ7_HETSC